MFVSVLLAILAVAASAVVLMRQNVMNSFGEYAVNIELDRLEQLSGHIARQYQAHKNWDFIGADRARWISTELSRLQQQRLHMAPPEPPEPPTPPAPPAPSEPVSRPAPDAVIEPPPLPLPAIAPEPAPPPEREAADQLGLQDRVTLLDADGRYLAGRSSSGEPGARRAISANGKTIGYLVVARAARPSDAMSGAFLQQMKDSLWIILAASLALSALAAVLLAAHFRKPILRLADAARELAAGRYDTRLLVARSD